MPWNQHLTKHLHPSVQQWHKMQIGYDMYVCASVQDNSVKFGIIHCSSDVVNPAEKTKLNLPEPPG